MHLVRARDGLRAGFRQREVAHLALLDEARHRADGVFDRHRRIDAVQAVEVDALDAEALQALVARLRHPVGMTARELRRAARVAASREREVAELGCDENARAPSLDRP